jgi:hypothetical protein
MGRRSAGADRIGVRQRGRGLRSAPIEARRVDRRVFLLPRLPINIALRREGVVVEIIIRVAGPLLVVIGLLLFAHGTGLITCPYDAAMVSYGAAVVAAGFAVVWLGWQ